MTAPGALSIPQTSPLQKLGFSVLLFFLFLLHSRILDLVLSTFHIPILSLYSSVAAAFASGGLVRAAAHRVGIAWLAFTMWMIFAVPFSVWPGGAYRYTILWLKVVLIYFVIVGLIENFDQFRRAIQVIAYAVLFLSLLTVPFGEMVDGRLVLERGRFENPNDLAQILLMSLPLWWFIAHDPKLSRPRRAFAYLAMLPIFWAMARTGSRGALIAALVVGLILFLRSTMAQKFQIVAGGGILLIAAALLLPNVLKQRYFTFFEADEAQRPRSPLEERVEDSAVSSAWGRWDMLQDSLAITARSPLFGVGAGQFVVAQDTYAREVKRLKKGSWQVTHNTYTEVSSETGIPGFVFYTLALIFTFRTAKMPRFRTRRLPPDVAEVVAASSCLRLSALAFTVSALFASLAYQTQLVTLAALAVVLSRTSRPILERRRVAPLQPGGTARDATLKLADGGVLKCAESQGS